MRLSTLLCKIQKSGIRNQKSEQIPKHSLGQIGGTLLRRRVLQGVEIEAAHAGQDIHVAGRDPEGTLEAGHAFPEEIQGDDDGGGEILLEEITWIGGFTGWLRGRKDMLAGLNE